MLAAVGFFVWIWKYRLLSRPGIQLGMIVGVIGFFVVGAQNHDFLLIISKGDNMPLVIMIFALMICLGIYWRKAAINDMRMEQGLPPKETEESNKKILVWPDLVFSEFICTVLLSAIFIAWSVAVEAPLEEPASGMSAPNPAKAPWYFLGLQEMLV